MAPIAILLRTVFESIFEVFLLCLAGYILARRGILDKKTQKQLNRLNVSLFTPSLLFSKVAFFLSPEKLRELWIIPIFFVIVTSVSMIVSFLLGWIFRLKRSQRSFAVAAAMFMNSNSLPIALMQSLVITVPGLKWDEDDTESAMLGRALTYLVLYSTMGMVLRWSYGVHLLSQADPESQETLVPDEESPLLESDETMSEGTPRTDNEPGRSDSSEFDTLHDRTPSIVFSDVDGSQDNLEPYVSDYAKPKGIPRIARRQGSALTAEEGKVRVFYSFPNTPTRSSANLPRVISADSLDVDVNGDPEHEEDELEHEIVARRRKIVTTPTTSRMHSLARRTWRRVKKVARTVNEFMTVPLWAAAASLLVALIPPLQHTIDSHVAPFKGALSAAGNCSIPLTLVVLGAYFYAPSEVGAKKEDAVLPTTITGPPTRHANESSTSTATGLSANRRYSDRSESSFVGSIKSMFQLSRLDKEAKGKRKEKRTRPGETRTVIIAVASRMIIVPLLLLPLMSISARYDIPKVFDDPVFILSNVLLISSPPALTLAQITQAASGDAFERLISRTIFWSYCIVTPPSTIIYVLIGLLIGKL